MNETPSNNLQKPSSLHIGGFLRNFFKRFRFYGKQPKIGVALGSGAGRGVAHIGVLTTLRRLGFPISFLSGSSAGSLVGALYAGGIENESLEKCGLEYGWRDAGRLNYVPKMGLASNDRLTEYLEEHIGNPSFEDLRIPFFVVTTNLSTGKICVFNKGPVNPAVRASCAIPGVFAPVEIDGELYCDGGLLSKLPCRVLREAGADIVVGVQLNRFVTNKVPSNVLEVIIRGLEVATMSQVHADIEAADLIIEPILDDLNEFGFNENPTVIERGKQATLSAIENWPHRKLFLSADLSGESRV